MPDGWYSEIVARLKPLPCHVAVDTSERPLLALAENFATAAPDLVKPNADELASLTGTSAWQLEHSAAQGDPLPVVTAAQQLIARGANTVLVTLGGAQAANVETCDRHLRMLGTERRQPHVERSPTITLRLRHFPRIISRFPIT